MPCGFLLGTESKGAHVSLFLTAFLPTKLQKESEQEVSGPLTLGDTLERTKQKEKKPVPANKDELLQWSGVATFPGKRLTEPRASISPDQSQFRPSCAHGTGGVTAAITASEASEQWSRSPPRRGQREARSSQIPLCCKMGKSERV